MRGRGNFMKVAWLVSGNIRNLVEIHDSWENNFFKYYDVDVYFHLWSYADFAEKGDAFFPDCCTYEEAVDLFSGHHVLSDLLFWGDFKSMKTTMNIIDDFERHNTVLGETLIWRYSSMRT